MTKKKVLEFSLGLTVESLLATGSLENSMGKENSKFIIKLLKDYGMKVNNFYEFIIILLNL